MSTNLVIYVHSTLKFTHRQGNFFTRQVQELKIVKWNGSFYTNCRSLTNVGEIDYISQSHQISPINAYFYLCFAIKLDHWIEGKILFMWNKLSSLTSSRKRQMSQNKVYWWNWLPSIVDTPNIQFWSCDINLKWFGKRECMKSPLFPPLWGWRRKRHKFCAKGHKMKSNLLGIFAIPSTHTNTQRER